jgi:hypothetical protein
MAWSETGYLKTVKDIAADAIAEYPFTLGLDNLDNDERDQFVQESVDGNEYVIYYGAQEYALRATDNEPYGEEVKALSSNNADWRAMKTTAAYLAMECDVQVEIIRRFAYRHRAAPTR